MTINYYLSDIVQGLQAHLCLSKTTGMTGDAKYLHRGIFQKS